MTDDAVALLGLPVRADGVVLGTVGAVWVDRADRVLGMEIRQGRSEPRRYLPYPAADLRGNAVEASPLVLLGNEPYRFLEDRGARRLTPTDAVS